MANFSEIVNAFFEVKDREIARIKHNKTYITSMFILPIVSICFFAAFFSKGAIDNLPVALVNEDNTPLSRTVADMIEGTPAVEFAYTVSDMTEAENLLLSGKVYAIVQIPKNFEKDILGFNQANIQLYNSGINVSTNGLIAKDVQTAVTMFSVGVQLNVLQSKGLAADQAMAMANPIAFSRHIISNPYLNYGYYLAPCFISMMIMVFTVLLTIFSIGSELKMGTAKEWLETAGNSISVAIFAKTSMIANWMMLVSVFAYSIVFVIMKAPMEGSLLFFIISIVVYIMAYQAVAIFIITLTGSLRMALSLGGGYSVLAFTFSGLTFPVMAMHPAMQVFSKFFPFTYFMEIYVDQAMRGAPVAVSMTPFALMLLFTVLLLFSIRKLKRACNDPKYWGKL